MSRAYLSRGHHYTDPTPGGISASQSAAMDATLRASTSARVTKDQASPDVSSRKWDRLYGAALVGVHPLDDVAANIRSHALTEEESTARRSEEFASRLIGTAEAPWAGRRTPRRPRTAH